MDLNSHGHAGRPCAHMADSGPDVVLTCHYGMTTNPACSK
jgi:hypothetical protein